MRRLLLPQNHVFFNRFQGQDTTKYQGIVKSSVGTPKAFTQYILNEVFCIGFECSAPLQSAAPNMGSAELHPEINFAAFWQGVKTYVDVWWDYLSTHLYTYIYTYTLVWLRVTTQRNDVLLLTYPFLQARMLMMMLTLHCVPSLTTIDDVTEVVVQLS